MLNGRWNNVTTCHTCVEEKKHLVKVIVMINRGLVLIGKLYWSIEPLTIELKTMKHAQRRLSTITGL